MQTLDKVLTIGRYTFLEILKSKILYSTLITGIALVVITYIATEFTYGVPEKVALDFGLGMLSLSSLGISLFMGATLLSKEIDSRTVYMVISRPVPRWVFILGKISGLLGVLCVNVGILSFMTLGSVYLLGGKISSMIVVAILFNVLECLLLLLVVVFFSLFSNTILASIISTIILIIGHAIRETQLTNFVKIRPELDKILGFYHFILPGFYKLNLKDFVTYNQDITTEYLISSATYGVLYSGFLLLMIIFIFNRKNID
jgi:ABC-2 type transport system permease protein